VWNREVVHGASRGLATRFAPCVPGWECTGRCRLFDARSRDSLPVSHVGRVKAIKMPKPGKRGPPGSLCRKQQLKKDLCIRYIFEAIAQRPRQTRCHQRKRQNAHFRFNSIIQFDATCRILQQSILPPVQRQIVAQNPRCPTADGIEKPLVFLEIWPLFPTMPNNLGVGGMKTISHQRTLQNGQHPDTTQRNEP
jgi:hypothetical protein